MSTPRDEAEARELIVGAFEAARQTGRADWSSMTAAVLKNRILQLTARTFNEHELGHERFTDLLDALSDLVAVDRTTQPPTVRLVDATVATQTAPADRPHGASRIRPDLWHAIVDYSTEQAWVWDGVSRVARTENEGDDLPRFPTISRGEMSNFRRSFANEYALGDPGHEQAERVQRWADDGLGTFVLPSGVRHLWNGFVKDEVWRRLTSFFDEINAGLPNDALQTRAPRASRTSSDEELQRLRSVVIEVVRAMTLSELSALQLPAAGVLRAQSRRGGQHK